MDSKTKKLVLAGLMAALTMVGTMLIQIPTITKGYIHAGDTIVYLCGVILGPVYGGLAAAIGSAMADAASGYAHYIIPTFLIKGLDAFVVGSIFHYVIRSAKVKSVIKFSIGSLLGTAIMVSGYFLYGTYLYGFETAVLGILGNVTQGVGGMALAIPLLLALEKTDIIAPRELRHKTVGHKS
ncbi:MAG: ECF transporter S component [Firmicutes bacterium]|jgi:uncharacterized membrane protein|nr:ECF transporter S component [Bacillota bacterium]